MNSLFLDFYGVRVRLLSSNGDILSLLKKDFSFFVDQKDLEADFNFNLNLEKIPVDKIPKTKAWRKSQSSITYDLGKTRFNNYYGRLLSIYDYEKDRADLYSESLNKLHEISYLLILSRVGKKMDLLGWHKLHAMGFIYKKKACLAFMSMGVGKSTLLSYLLANPNVEFLSDDTPLISSTGEVKAFPIRLGVGEFPEHFKIVNPKENVYQLDRDLYGRKDLLCLEGLSNKVGRDYRKTFLMKGIRIDDNECLIKESNKPWILIQLIYHMVIGVGLPMIFEYFWESGTKDFLKKTKIFFYRLRASINLVLNSDVYGIYLGNDKELNAQTLLKFLEQE